MNREDIYDIIFRLQNQRVTDLKLTREHLNTCTKKEIMKYASILANSPYSEDD